MTAASMSIGIVLSISLAPALFGDCAYSARDTPRSPRESAARSDYTQSDAVPADAHELLAGRRAGGRVSDDPRSPVEPADSARVAHDLAVVRDAGPALRCSPRRQLLPDHRRPRILRAQSAVARLGERPRSGVDGGGIRGGGLDFDVAECAR